MTLVNAKALAWALLAVPIVLFYLWRVRPRRHAVATGFLWEQVFGTSHHESTWWLFRHPVSLCLQLAALLLLVLALAEPHFRPPSRLVLVIDHSASMNATDARPTRLDQARQLARQRIAALGCRDQMAMITAGDVLRVHCRLTSEQDTLQQALRGVVATNGPTRVADAVALGRRLLEGKPSGRIIVLSDGCFDGATELARQDDVELIAVGGPGDNVAVTRLEARRSLNDPLRCQVLIEVTSYVSEPVECRLELELAGKPIEAVPIELSPAGRWQQVFEMTTAEGGQLTARLDRPDVFPDDDHASAPVPPSPIHQVTLVTDGNLYLEKVLEASPLVKLTVTDAPPEKMAEGTILVLHRRTPSPLTPGPVLVLDPTGPCELWELGDPLENPTIAKQNDGLPPLADVRLEGVQLSGFRRLVLSDEARSMAQPVAWTADGVPVGYVIHRPGGRVLVLCGVVEGGDLPLRTAFPILMGNGLDWVAASDGTPADPSENERLAAMRFVAGESDVRVPAGLASQAGTAATGSPGLPLWPFPVAMALLLAVVEWSVARNARNAWRTEYRKL